MFPPASLVEQVRSIFPVSLLQILCKIVPGFYFGAFNGFPDMEILLQEDYNAWNFWKVPLPDIK
ncbi:phosphatidate phosphatase PAH1-like [Gossypium australe]|nr:phosphatidate phosphatase PAH1-like [Gossypium australe]